MSKSVGNMVTIDQFLREHPGDVMRLWVLNGSYRSPLTYNEAVIEQTTQGYKRLLSAKKGALPGVTGLLASEMTKLEEAANSTRQAFVEAMDDDFNTSLAMAAIYELVKVINQARTDGANDAQLGIAQTVFNELTNTLGLTLEEEATSGTSADAFIDLLVALRRDLRAEKNWAMSDKIRDELKVLGVILEDSKDGTTWSWEN